MRYIQNAKYNNKLKYINFNKIGLFIILFKKGNTKTDNNINIPDKIVEIFI